MQIDLFTVYDAILAAGAGGGGGGWVGETNTAKVTYSDCRWDFGPLGTAIKPLQRGGFPQRKCFLKEICTEINFVKCKEEIH